MLRLRKESKTVLAKTMAKTAAPSATVAFALIVGFASCNFLLALWTTRGPPPDSWTSLPPDRRAAAARLGYDRSTWEGDDDDVRYAPLSDKTRDMLTDAEWRDVRMLKVEDGLARPDEDDDVAPTTYKCADGKPAGEESGDDDVEVLEGDDELDDGNEAAPPRRRATGNAQEEEGRPAADDEGAFDVHYVAGLDCAAHGGPDDPEATEEVIWWRDVPADARRRSPFLATDERDDDPTSRSYLTFEPDDNGFNNNRMGFETALVIAAATGRTLVLPPKGGDIAHLDDAEDAASRPEVHDFFMMRSILKEHPGVRVVAMREFLATMGVTGNLKRFKDGVTMFPPGNRTDWDGGRDAWPDCLYEYLHAVSVRPRWNLKRCVLAMPASKSPSDVRKLKDLENRLRRTKVLRDYEGSPTPVDGSPFDRLMELAAGRRKLCVYDEVLQSAPLVHVSYRLLTQPHSFLFFQDWKADVYYKRFVRDHVRYNDDIMCAAARVLRAAREKAGRDGTFDALHVRRNDFGDVSPLGAWTAEDFLNEVTEHLKDGSVVYIATDEKNKAFFEPFMERYRVFFLDDFEQELEGVDKNYYGMVDQVVAAKGRSFFGCYHSTFSAYLNRLRGYYSTKNELEGYREGGLRSYYFSENSEDFDVMGEYNAIEFPFWGREFPVAWRDIDRDIDVNSNAKR
ncbi:hypothetical protein ACHAWF_016363 [Thalassiosira exigua]